MTSEGDPDVGDAWPLALPLVSAVGALLFTHNYYYFTTIHLTAIVVLIVAAMVLLAAGHGDRVTRAWAAVCLTTAIHLSLFVGVWVAWYLIGEPCGVRSAADSYHHSMATVALGHWLQHGVLAGLLWLTVPPRLPLPLTIPQLLLPAACFVAYSGYARPCQIYPVDNPTTTLPWITAGGAVAYGLLGGGWVWLSGREGLPL